MTPTKDAPERLKQWREANGISLRAASNALGVSHVAYRGWELRTSIPHVDMRKAIAIWTHGEVTEDMWPISPQEQHIIEAAAKVVPFEPAAKADDTGTHAVVDADKTG